MFSLSKFKKLLGKEAQSFSYEEVERVRDTQQSLNKAFDVLFDEVLRRRESNVKACPQKVWTIKDN